MVQNRVLKCKTIPIRVGIIQCKDNINNIKMLLLKSQQYKRSVQNKIVQISEIR